MKLRRTFQCVHAALRNKSDTRNKSKRQSTSSNESNLHYRAARQASLSTNVIKKEKDDQKDAINTLRAILSQKDDTIDVKTKVKQEDMAKTALHTANSGKYLYKQIFAQ